MKKEEAPNFLPQDEKHRADEVLQKQAQQGNAEMKLVIPQMDNNAKNKGGKKESFWQRRKRLKQEKKEAEMRRRGETGSVKQNLQKEVDLKMTNQEPKPELFSDIIARKEEGTPVQPVVEKPKQEEVKKDIPKPKKPEQEKKQEQPPIAVPKKVEVKQPAAKAVSQKSVSVSPKPKNTQPEQETKKMHEPEKNGQDFDGPSVNLVPDTMMPQSGGPNWILGLVIILVTIAIWVVIGGIGASQAKKAEAQVLETTAKIAQINKIITEFDSGKQAAQSLQEQFNSVEGLIDNHLYWTPLLTKLEENTISDVYYLAVNADKETQIVSVQAIAKNYAAAARQIRSFQLAPNFISKVTVGEVRVENQPDAELPVPIVTFSLQLELKEGVLTFVSPDSTN